MKAKSLVLSQSDSVAERLLLIRTLQEGYNKTTNSPRRRAAQEDDDNKSAQSVRSSTTSWWRSGGGRSTRVDIDVQPETPKKYARISNSFGGQRQRSLRWKTK
jgi:hypothetical protein